MMARTDGNIARRWWMLIAGLMLAVMTSVGVALAGEQMPTDDEGEPPAEECHEEDTSAEPTGSCPEFGAAIFTDGRRIELRRIATRQVTVSASKEWKLSCLFISAGGEKSSTETRTYGMYESPDGYGVEINCYSRDVVWHGPRRSEDGVGGETLGGTTF